MYRTSTEQVRRQPILPNGQNRTTERTTLKSMFNFEANGT